VIIGDENAFAVEFDLDVNHGGSWMYGRICYWINCDQIGDYSLGTSLRDVLFSMKYLVGDCGNREESMLCELPYNEAFHVIDKSIFKSTAIDKIDMPSRFKISIDVDVFDFFKVYLIDCSNKSIILYKKNQEETKYFVLKKGWFDSVIKRFYITLDSIYKSSLEAEKNL
jgi:hypothetical protein